MYPMETAPRDRKITLFARQLIVGLGPVPEPPFAVQGRYYPEHDFWAAEDREFDGKVYLRPLHPHGWIC